MITIRNYFEQARIAEEMFREDLENLDLTTDQLRELWATGCITCLEWE